MDSIARPATLSIGEYDDGAARVADLFQAKFGGPPPDFPRHVLAYLGGGDEAGDRGEGCDGVRDERARKATSDGSGARREADSTSPARLLCYVHFTAYEGALLGGGACVDTRVLKRASAAERALVAERGGAYFATLTWAMQHLAAHADAIFGYCGDPSALRTDLAAGFERTEHPYLLVHWTRAVSAARRAELIAKVHAMGPF